MKDKHKKHEEGHADKDDPNQAGEAGTVSPVGALLDSAGKAVSSSDGAPDPGQVKTVPEEKYLRLFADFDNFRKRTVRERSELYQRANAELVADLLPVLDHLEMALESAAAHKSEGAVIDGFKLVADQMLGAMNRAGLIPMVCDGAVFDPMIHEAISHLPSDTVPESYIISQVRKGYTFGGKMLRAARVIVSSGKQVVQPETQAGVVADGDGLSSNTETINKEN